MTDNIAQIRAELARLNAEYQSSHTEHLTGADWEWLLNVAGIGVEALAIIRDQGFATTESADFEGDPFFLDLLAVRADIALDEMAATLTNKGEQEG